MGAGRDGWVFELLVRVGFLVLSRTPWSDVVVDYAQATNPTRVISDFKLMTRYLKQDSLQPPLPDSAALASIWCDLNNAICDEELDLRHKQSVRVCLLSLRRYGR